MLVPGLWEGRMEVGCPTRTAQPHGKEDAAQTRVQGAAKVTLSLCTGGDIVPMGGSAVFLVQV